ncbi:hypothetical protein C8Q78DRAFT_770568 [Trametes maxima]|nr:hypothetical protein C8Q78DRAFT_770568 [Trametes maxima]
MGGGAALAAVSSAVTEDRPSFPATCGTVTEVGPALSTVSHTVPKYDASLPSIRGSVDEDNTPAPTVGCTVAEDDPSCASIGGAIVQNDAARPSVGGPVIDSPTASTICVAGCHCPACTAVCALLTARAHEFWPECFLLRSSDMTALANNGRATVDILRERHPGDGYVLVSDLRG